MFSNYIYVTNVLDFNFYTDVVLMVQALVKYISLQQISKALHLSKNWF